jgi:hypothetical protein
MNFSILGLNANGEQGKEVAIDLHFAFALAGWTSHL